MYELTMPDVDLEVVVVGDLTVLRAVTNTLVVNLPLTATAVELVRELLKPALAA